MEAEGIIEEHEGPAPWISNVVLAPKDDGQVRVTLDMKRTNKAIKATNIPIPRIEDIKSTLGILRSLVKQKGLNTLKPSRITHKPTQRKAS